ncbi:hypothetical protein E8E14_004296 [Neopestalotiopsis sp. 37M]|nr:hypothetical protein E8E14_004296 [Neopestalotiopsis sp. 37M]
MNDELFRPRGLYCLVMAYDTNSHSEHTPQNPGTGTVGLISRSAGNASFGTWEKVGSNDGITGAPDFPVPAELVYPGLLDATPTGQDLGTEEREDSETRTRGSSLASRLI